MSLNALSKSVGSLGARSSLLLRRSCVLATPKYSYTSEKPQASHSVVLCNHGLPSLSTNINNLYTDHLGNLSSVTCGHCSLLGINHGTSSVANKGLLNSYSSFSSSCHQDTNWIIFRSFHSSPLSRKEESVATKTVKALKDQVKPKSAEGAEATEAVAEQQAPVAESAAPAVKPVQEPASEPSTPPPTPPVETPQPTVTSAVPSDSTEKDVAPAKKTIKEKVVDVLKHYYHGFRLLFIDVRVCARYAWRLSQGKHLTRRERKQLVRTTADLFRLVPFLVFIIVPFMEFLLPVALKLFPNMLPSTFQEADKEQEKLRKRLKVKLEMAKFLQDTIEDTALTRKGAKGESVQGFVQFMEKVRESGKQTTVDEIRKYSHLFENDITLDTLNHRQLMALCRLLDIPLPNLGTTNFLRFQIRMKLRSLEADDKMIVKEGLDALSVWELQEACRARGMRSLGVSKERLKVQLQQWLTMVQDAKIPTSLLLLSRALYIPETLSTEDQVKATIASLPNTTTEEAKVKISEVSADRVDNKAKLDVIRQEEEAIRAEKEAEKAAKLKAAADKEAKRVAAEAIAAEKRRQEEELARKAVEAEAMTPAAAAAQAQELPTQAAQEAQEIIQEAQKILKPSIVDSAPAEPAAIPKEELLVDKATDLTETAAKGDKLEDKVEELQPAEAAAAATPAETSAATPAPSEEEDEDDEISKEDLEDIEDVLEHVASEREKLKLEKKELATLKEDIEEYKEAVSELKEVVVATGGSIDDIRETKAAQRLSSHVDKMLEEMSEVMDKLHTEKQVLTEELEVKEVRVRRSAELAEDDEAREKVMGEISQHKASLVSINELMLGLRRIQKVPDDTKVQQILQVLDEDEDGNIDVNDALKVIEMLATENVKLNKKAVANVLKLMRRESEIEKDDKETKLKEKQEKSNSAATLPIEEILRDTAEELKSDSGEGKGVTDSSQEVAKNEDKQKQ